MSRVRAVAHGGQAGESCLYDIVREFGLVDLNTKAACES